MKSTDCHIYGSLIWEKFDGKVVLAHWGNVLFNVRLLFLYAGKSDSDYIDAFAYFDIQLHVFQSLQH